METHLVPSGISGFDQIINGGFMPGSSYLIVGSAGTGKTIMSLQFFAESVKRKASCLYFTFAEPVEKIKRNARSFGWDIDEVVFVDFTKQIGEDEITGEYSVFPPSEVERIPIWKQIYQAIGEYSPDRVVIDSATFLRYLSTDEYQYRKQVQKLINYLSDRKCISLFLFEPTELEREASLSLAVDAVIFLRMDTSPGKVTEIRTVEVVKVRYSSFLPGRHPMRITPEGIVVWPHRTERLKSLDFERGVLSSGIEALDELLDGGFQSGTCTIITGPTGVGKSSLGTQFICAAAQGGMKGAIYTFEEGLSSIIDRCRGISIPLEDMVEDGSVIVREINPLECYPDEFLDLVRTDIERGGVEVTLIDSLRGYNLAMEEFGNLVANMQNILNYTRGKGASIFLVNEMEKLTGEVQLTDTGVSYLSDNILMLRYAEHRGKIIKVVSCLKKRLGEFKPELREFEITPNGIRVGENLDYLQGLLTGVPSYGFDHAQ